MFYLSPTSNYFSASYKLHGFPHNSVGKESTCNAGDPSSIPRSGRSAGEGIGYPLQFSWASLVAQLVKNLPARCETWIRSLGWEDPLGNGKAKHSSILACRIYKESSQRIQSLAWITKSWTWLSHFNFHIIYASIVWRPWTFKHNSFVLNKFIL